MSAVQAMTRRIQDGRIVQPQHTNSPEEWKAIVENTLAKIGWSLRHAGGYHYYILDHKGRSSHWQFVYDRIEREERLGGGADSLSSVDCSFYLKDCEIQYEEKYTSVYVFGKQNKNIFLTFHRYDPEERD